MDESQQLAVIPDTTIRRHWSFPHAGSVRVQEMAERIERLSQGDDRVNGFHRSYFVNHLVRIAMNIVFLQDLVRPGESLLDVGSFGIEPAVLKHDMPELEVKALSLEGNRIAIGADGFVEGRKLDLPGTIMIDKVDVERDRFPYEDRAFDWVSAFEILEHLRFSPLPMLQEIKRVLRPGGILILTTPNICSARSFTKMLQGHSPQESPHYHSSFEYGVIHAKEYTLYELSVLLEYFGFEIELLRAIDTSKVSRAEEIVRATIAGVKSALSAAIGSEFSGWDSGERLVAVARNARDRADELPALLFSDSGKGTTDAGADGGGDRPEDGEGAETGSG